MEILRPGTDDVMELSVRGCCWPPSIDNITVPEPEE